jgi:hypothetical protein
MATTNRPCTNRRAYRPERSRLCRGPSSCFRPLPIPNLRSPMLLWVVITLWRRRPLPWLV